MMLRFAPPMIKKWLKCSLLLVWCFAVSTGWTQETDSTRIIEAAIRHQNLGLAYLEESQPSKAVAGVYRTHRAAA